MYKPLTYGLYPLETPASSYIKASTSVQQGYHYECRDEKPSVCRADHREHSKGIHSKLNGVHESLRQIHINGQDVTGAKQTFLFSLTNYSDQHQLILKPK